LLATMQYWINLWRWVCVFFFKQIKSSSSWTL